MARAARRTSIDPTKVQIVHVWNRCVRRAYHCGQDPLTGKDFEHRRQWAQKRLEHLASVFAIDWRNERGMNGDRRGECFEEFRVDSKSCLLASHFYF